MALIVVIVLLSIPVSGAGAQDQSPCEVRFPEQVWEPAAEAGGVDVYRAALTQAIAERFASTAVDAAAMIRADLGLFPNTTLCIFGTETALNPEGLLPPGQRLHAATFVAEALVVVDAQQIRLVDDAIVFGMAHIGLWHLAAAGGDEGYPEPLAGAIKQWYVARVGGSLERHHSIMRVANFFNDPEGKVDSTDWFTGVQVPIIAWNPEYQENPIGDFVDDAVARNGTRLLQEPNAAAWAAAEVVWRDALREELLQGADESRDWIGGVLLATGAVLGAVGLALWGRRQNRRKQVPIGEIAHVEGFFDH